MIGHSKFGSEAIRFPGSRFKALCNFLRIVKSIFTVFDHSGVRNSSKKEKEVAEVIGLKGLF